MPPKRITIASETLLPHRLQNVRQVRNILFLGSLAQAVQEIYLALRVLAFSTAGSPITSITMASKTRIKRPRNVAITLIILAPPWDVPTYGKKTGKRS